MLPFAAKAGVLEEIHLEWRVAEIWPKSMECSRVVNVNDWKLECVLWCFRDTLHTINI
jgi:hypothetical protein